VQVDRIDPPGHIAYGDTTFGSVTFHGRILV
jgi:hypothetical protein